MVKEIIKFVKKTKLKHYSGMYREAKMILLDNKVALYTPFCNHHIGIVDVKYRNFDEFMTMFNFYMESTTNMATALNYPSQEYSVHTLVLNLDHRMRLWRNYRETSIADLNWKYPTLNLDTHIYDAGWKNIDRTHPSWKYDVKNEPFIM
jgi:hypothetical protein